MNKEYGIYAAIALAVAALAVGIWWMRSNPSPSPQQTATTTDSGTSTTTATAGNTTTTPAAAQPQVSQTNPPAKPAYQFSLVPGEAVASWNFAGTHKDGGQLEAGVRADITRLEGLLNSGTFTNYELYVSIANQYELLGDGKQEFTHLNYAIAIDSTKTGLAWHNMGKLLEHLGAYKSARVAYDRMIQAQSTSQYIRARLEFLQTHMPEDTAAIAQAQADLAASTW